MKEEHHDLSTSEISSLVYNTRGVKPYHIKPLRVNQGQASSMIPSIENPPAADKSKTTDQLNTEVPIDSAHSNERLFLKLNSLLLRRVERPEHAQSIVSVLKKLRKNFPVEKIIEKHFEHHFLFPLISSCDFFMKFDYLVEEALAFILPLVRQEGKRQNLMDDILSSGAFLFSFASIRQYISNPNIRSLSLELLVCSIDFILELVMVNSPYKDKKYANQSFVVHELVLHGGTTFLPSLLASFLHSQSEIGIRRVLKCIKFLILRTTVQVAQAISSANNFSLIRNCLTIIRTSSIESQMDAAIILTGLSASSLIISEKLMELNGWEDVRTILANPNLNFSGKMLYYHRSSPLTEMPSSWLEQSTKSMKIIYLKRSSQFPETATPLEWANDIPEIKPTEQLDEIESPSQSGKKKGQLPHSTLATLPTSYWLERDNPKSHIRASPANSTLPRCKDRLLNSPFGDPRKLIKIQQKRAIQARAAQAKYRSLNKKDTSSSKPRPSSAGATSKELNVDNRADLPKDFRKQVAVAEKLFGGERGDSDCDGHADSPSALDQLTYEERLTVMMMQIKNDRYE